MSGWFPLMCSPRPHRSVAAGLALPLSPGGVRGREGSWGEPNDTVSNRMLSLKKSLGRALKKRPPAAANAPQRRSGRGL